MKPISKLKKFIEDSKHVMAISYKPTQEQFMKSAKIIIIGIIIVGTLGLIIAIIASLVITGSLALI